MYVRYRTRSRKNAPEEFKEGYLSIPVTYGDLHGTSRNFQGIIRDDKHWYSWSQSEVVVRDRIPGDHPRYSETVVTFGSRTANVRIESFRERQGVILHPCQAYGSNRERFLLLEIK